MKTKEITPQEARLAWAQDKKVEAGPRTSGAWIPVRPNVSIGGHQHSADVLLDPSFIYRLTPEPPAKKFRPWTPEEVPVNAWFKGENGIGFKLAYADLWGGSRSATVANGSGSHLSLDYILKAWTWSPDNGKTWLPCGVEVSE